MNQESDFYKDLDRTHRQEKEKTLSVWSLTIFFMVLIALAEGLIFYLGSGLRAKGPDDLTSGKAIQGLNLVAVSSDSATPIYIPEGVLCSEVANIIKNEAKCSITEENIIVSGKISALLPANANAYFTANNTESKGSLELSEVKIGKVSTFKFMAAPLSSVLNKAIQASAGGDIKIKRIDLERGIMVLKIDK